MNRRGFVRGLLGLLGLGAAAKMTVLDKRQGYHPLQQIQPGAVIHFQGMEGKESLSDSEIDRLRKEFEAMYAQPGRLFVLPPGSQIRSL